MRFVVFGNSMAPTFAANDKLFVSKLLYKIMSPKVDDVVVLTDPRDKRLILKKVDGVFGDKYFVVGENLTESTDSRTFGAVNKRQIVGKVLFRYKKVFVAKKP